MKMPPNVVFEMETPGNETVSYLCQDDENSTFFVVVEHKDEYGNSYLVGNDNKSMTHHMITKALLDKLK